MVNQYGKNSVFLDTYPSSNFYLKQITLWRLYSVTIFSLYSCHTGYSGKTSIPLEACIKEHKYDLIQGQLEKSKLTVRAYKDGYRIC
jgi:hypothetical protein